MPAAKGSVPWNAGTGAGWTDKRGYRWVYVTDKGRRRARREHRVLVERSIGRSLEPWEVVHHKDGNPSNNSIENLEVKEFGAHTAEHATGTRKSYDARRQMEAFSLMREELKAERLLRNDLLAELSHLVRLIGPHEEAGTLNIHGLATLNAARAAIAKATEAA